MEASKAIHLLEERGLFKVDWLRGELELLFLLHLELVSEAFCFLGECWAEVEGALDPT